MNEMRTNQNFQYITRRIGATTFKVRVVFNDTGQETMEDKTLRIVHNEVVTNAETYGTIGAPRMSRQSERSAS